MIFLCFFWAVNLRAQEVTHLSWRLKAGDKQARWLSFFSEEAKLNYMDSVVLAHRGLGYLSAYWETSTRSDSTQAVLDLGPRVEELSIGVAEIPADHLKAAGALPKNFPEYTSWQLKLLEYAEDSGYPFASVQLTDPKREGSRLSGTVQLDLGPLIIWDSVQVEGSTKTNPTYLQNLSFIRVGEPFSQEELDRAVRLVSRSPYFRLVSPAQVSFQQRKASPIFQLRDRTSNVLDGIIGILPNENEPGEVLLTGQLDLELYHLGGKGRDLGLHWQRLNIQTQSLDLSYRESFLLGTPISTTLAFSLLKQDSTFLNRAFELDFSYRPGPDLSLSFFTRRQASDLISAEGLGEITELPDVADYRWNQYGAGLDWSTLDDPELPRNGARVQLTFSAGNKRIIQNTAIPEEIYAGLDLTSPQYSLNGSAEKHFFFKPAWGMWIHASAGWIDNSNLLLNDLFRIGGLKTIRGFNENFFYARSFAFVNMEQRLFFGERSYLMVFGDAGWVQDPFADESRDLPVSLGAGITLDTGNGLFKFILGVGSSNEQPFSFSYSRIHFGYVARF